MKNEYVIKGDTVIIKAIRKGEGHDILIDAEDFEEVSGFKGTWHVDNRGYVGRTIKQKRELMHRILLSPPQGMVVDHIDGNKLNNRRSNLRVIKPSHNQQNIRFPHKLAKSGYRGVKKADGVQRDGMPE